MKEIYYDIIVELVCVLWLCRVFIIGFETIDAFIMGVMWVICLKAFANNVDSINEDKVMNEAKAFEKRNEIELND